MIIIIDVMFHNISRKRKKDPGDIYFFCKWQIKEKRGNFDATVIEEERWRGDDLMCKYGHVTFTDSGCNHEDVTRESLINVE